MNNFNTIIDDYNVDEEFMYNTTYLFIKGFALGRNLTYTLKALPFVRKVHNGQYRKGTIAGKDGKEYQVPYVLHVLKVCSTLISLELPLTNDELDMLCLVALCHDVLEDAPEGFFANTDHEFVTTYGFPEEAYQTIRLLSKRSGATIEELNLYFNEIKKNKIALLVKMADRSHNVEDLYNMKIEKLHKYVDETRRWIYPLSSYAKANYPEISNGVTILKSKIMSLTEATETIVTLYDEKLKEKDKEIERLKEELANYNIKTIK